MNMTKRKEFKDSLKKLTLEESIEQRVASMENDVASLQEERKINPI